MGNQVRDSSGNASGKKKFSVADCLCGKRFRRYAFVTIVIFLAALTIHDVVELFMEYYKYPKQSDLTIIFNETMTMPNVTFCMSKKQAYSHFKINDSAPADEWDRVVDENLSNMTDHDSFLNNPWDFRMVMESYEVISAFTSLERETTAHGSARSITVFRLAPQLASKRAMAKKWIDAIKERGVTFDEYMQKTGVEVLKRSMQRFQRTSYNESLVIRTRMRISWISQMQMCFQPWFDEDNFYDIEDQGTFFTMMLSHNAENLEGEDVDCMAVDLHGRPSSLNRFMEGKGRTRDGVTDELCLGMRHEVKVEVKQKYSMIENDDPGTACREVEDGDDNEFDCRSRCRMEMIRDHCNCTALSISYLASDEDLEKYPLCDYTQCELDIQNGNFSDTECSSKCLRDCEQIRIEIDHVTQGRMARPDLTLVNLNWGSFEYINMEQEWVWTIASFIAALGGSIGMWLGLSILSLIQITSYLYDYFTENVVKEKILKKQPSRDGGDLDDDDGKKRKRSNNPLANPFKYKMPRGQVSTETDPDSGTRPRVNAGSRSTSVNIE